MDIISNLILLGLNEKEASVYLAGIKLGTSNASKLSQISQIKRGTIYGILRELKLKNLCQESVKKKQKSFTMQDPNSLKTIQNQRDNALANILPLLRNLQQKETSPQIQLFSGLDEVKKIMEDILTSKVEVQEISSGKFVTTLGMDWCIKYVQKRVANNISIRTIVTGDKEAKFFHQRDSEELREMRFIQTKSEINMALEIYENKIAIISFTDKPFGIIIEDEKISKSLRALFEVMWSTI